MCNKYVKLQHHRILKLISEEVQTQQQGVSSSHQVYDFNMTFRHEVERSIDKFLKVASPLIGEHAARHEVARSLMIFVESNDWSMVHGTHPPTGL
jgi:hypothetical protein